MPRFLLARGDRGRIDVEARNDQDELIGRDSSRFCSDAHFAKAAKALRTDRDTLVRIVDAFERTGRCDFVVSPSGQSSSLTLRVRGLLDTADKAQSLVTENPIDSLCLLFNTPTEFVEPVVAWDSPLSLCAVDMDAEYWNERRLQELLETFEPKPALAWVTKGGGLRMVFHAHERLNAEEVAAVAYLHLSASARYTSLELKTDTRFPTEKVFRQQQGTDFSVLRRWLRQYSVDDTVTADWLADRGMKVGDRLEHDKCPVSPSTTAKGTPVLVTENGIKCFVCEAHGVLCGSSKPGFFPYSAFVGGSTATLLYSCLENMTHWEHAQHVMEELFNSRNYAMMLAYRAALKLHHAQLTNDLCDIIMSAGRNLLRMDGRWTNSNGESYTKELKAVVASLPAACAVNEKGKFNPLPARVSALQQTFDLDKYGYPHLTPIFGLKMFTRYAESKDYNKVRVVVQTPVLSRDNMERLRPRYVESTKRVASPWDTICRLYPGICVPYVKLMLVAKGYAEGATGMPPMVFVTGPTGAAKTGCIHVAASIAGDCVSEHVWSSNVDRTRQAIKDSKDTGTYVAFNEFMKEAERQKQTALQAADFILNLTPNSMSWKIWTGPVRLGDLPVFIWTDTRMPLELKQDAQLARRLIHVNLSSEVDWRPTLFANGISQIQDFRVSSQEHADIANTIISEIIDEFFKSTTSFEEAARSLGFTPLRESAEAEEGNEALVAFYKAVCAAPALDGADATRWSGKGWKLINRNQVTPLQELWEQICDESWRESRRCTAEDWQKLMKAKHPIRFEGRVHGSSRMAVRFRSADGNRTTYLVNEELL